MKILFVGYGSSIHTARWISQFGDQRWSVHLFPVDSYYLCAELCNVTVHLPFKYSNVPSNNAVKQSVTWPFSRGKTRITQISSKLFGDPLSSASRLVRVIQRIKPDLVHSFELTGGLLTHEAITRLTLKESTSFTWIHSSWGSDLLHFGRLEEFHDQTLRMMRSCRYFMADCQRELNLAGEFGFKGELLGVYSAGGGYDVMGSQKYRSNLPVSERKIVALKGRHEETLLGRGFYALKALEMCKDVLRDHKIVVYLPQGDVRGAVNYIRTVTNLNITLIPEHSKHEDILTLFGQSKFAIALGLIDGTPHSMLEAMMMGAWPIQSNTADTDGWVTDSLNGSLVPPEDPSVLAEKIKFLLTNDQLLDNASSINFELLLKRKDIGVVKPAIISIYQRLASNSKYY